MLYSYFPWLTIDIIIYPNKGTNEDDLLTFTREEVVLYGSTYFINLSV